MDEVRCVFLDFMLSEKQSVLIGMNCNQEIVLVRLNGEDVTENDIMVHHVMRRIREFGIDLLKSFADEFERRNRPQLALVH